MTYSSTELPNDGTWLKRIRASASSFSHCVLLDSCAYSSDAYGRFDWLAAGGAMLEVQGEDVDSLEQVQRKNPGWWFCRLGYELKNQFEDLRSENPSHYNWKTARMFMAEWVAIKSGDNLTLHLHPRSELTITTWEALFEGESVYVEPKKVSLQSRMTRDTYIDHSNQLKEHIQRGDIYEVNFCHEYYAEQAQVNPARIYTDLLKKAAPPMSALWKTANEWVLSMSPERYLQRDGRQIISQPIKGTAKRHSNPKDDEQSATELAYNPKERAENVMIVDLVRNDLARVAKRNSVDVPELFKVYPFATVHQMISTVKASLKDEADIWDVLRASFPMGSMTGAPKVRAMELIESYELNTRGIYSGTIGYITPNGDFDFNVVIRSVVYDAIQSYLSVSVGSALTSAANPEKEWDECELKLRAIREVLENVES